MEGIERRRELKTTTSWSDSSESKAGAVFAATVMVKESLTKKVPVSESAATTSISRTPDEAEETVKVREE